jgi:hypothetical protein
VRLNLEQVAAGNDLEPVQSGRRRPLRVVGWSDGARPDRRGSAVITGHTVHSGGGAFDQGTPSRLMLVTCEDWTGPDRVQAALVEVRAWPADWVTQRGAAA